MKIPDRNSAGIPPGPDKASSAQTHRAEQAQKAKAVHQKTPAGASIEIGSGPSPDSVQMSRLAGAIRADDLNTPERAAKIERLEAEVRSGKYQVDSQALSRSLVDDMIRE